LKRLGRTPETRHLQVGERGGSGNHHESRERLGAGEKPDRAERREVAVSHRGVGRGGEIDDVEQRLPGGGDTAALGPQQQQPGRQREDPDSKDMQQQDEAMA